MKHCPCSGWGLVAFASLLFVAFVCVSSRALVLLFALLQQWLATTIEPGHDRIATIDLI